MSEGDESNTPNATDRKTVENDVDEEGLQKAGYDVILCGTNLIHSILASALSLAGKSILQCDGADYYGEVDTSMDLKRLLKWAEVCESVQIGHAEGNNESRVTDGSEVIRLSEKGSWSGFLVHSYSSLKTDQNPDKQSEDLKTEEKKSALKVQTPYGIGTVINDSQSTLNGSLKKAITLDAWTLADGKSHPVLYSYNNHPPVESNQVDYATESLSLSRSFALDMTINGPLLLANDKAVSGLVSSNVADYIEFKSVQSLHVLLPSINPIKSSRSSSALSSTLPLSTKIAKEENESSLSLQRVPCSKGDVFQTNLLSPLEKRKLMKFLQLISDYGISKQQTEQMKQHQPPPGIEKEKESTVETPDQGLENQAIQYLNERKLNQGRSLSRPQNKHISTSSLQQLKSILLAEKNGDIENSSPVHFHTYLQETLKLSPRLTNLILYTLAMQTISTGHNSKNQDKVNCTPTTVHQGITALVQHLNSLGRFGKTAFLAPIYGSGELSQAFCRSSAVHGGIFLLRRCPTEIIWGQKETLTMEEGESKALAVHIMGDPDMDKEQRSKVIKCKHVVVSKAALLTGRDNDIRVPKITSRVLKRISIIHGTFPSLESGNSLEEDGDGQSQIIIIPPQTPHIENLHAIQGVILDHSSNVAPSSYSVVYLSTIVENRECTSIDTEVLERALTSILACANSEVKKEDKILNEVHHVCFSVVNEIDETEGGILSTASTNNLHVSHLPSQSLTVEQAFQEAERIFSTICTNDQITGTDEENQGAQKFLQICPALLKIREEHRNIGYGDLDEDDEKLALESALSMINTENNIEDSDANVSKSENAENIETNGSEGNMVDKSKDTASESA